MPWCFWGKRAALAILAGNFVSLLIVRFIIWLLVDSSSLLLFSAVFVIIFEAGVLKFLLKDMPLRKALLFSLLANLISLVIVFLYGLTLPLY